MKPWNEIKEQDMNVRRALKIEDNFWRWWKEQDVLKEKGVVERVAQAERTAAFMAWADDGGPTA